MKKRIVLVLFCFVIISCGAYPTKTKFSHLSPAEGKTRLYIYTDCEGKGHQGPKIFVNGTQRAVLAGDTFYSTYVNGEKVLIEAKSDFMNYDGMETLRIEPALNPIPHDLYVKFHTIVDKNKSTLVVTYFNYVLEQVSEAQGETEITNCFRAKEGYYSNKPSEI